MGEEEMKKGKIIIKRDTKCYHLQNDLLFHKICKYRLSIVLTYSKRNEKV